MCGNLWGLSLPLLDFTSGQRHDRRKETHWSIGARARFGRSFPVFFERKKKTWRLVVDGMGSVFGMDFRLQSTLSSENTASGLKSLWFFCTGLWVLFGTSGRKQVVNPRRASFIHFHWQGWTENMENYVGKEGRKEGMFYLKVSSFALYFLLLGRNWRILPRPLSESRVILRGVASAPTLTLMNACHKLDNTKTTGYMPVAIKFIQCLVGHICVPLCQILFD